MAADSSQVRRLIESVDRLKARLNRLNKRQLKKFYGIKFSDEQVADVRHQCYLALLDSVDARVENRVRRKDARSTERGLNKLRKGYGRLAKLSAKQVAACEERRIPECDRLLSLPDSPEVKMYRAEIGIIRDEVRQIREAIVAHERIVTQALSGCDDGLKKLGNGSL